MFDNDGLPPFCLQLVGHDARYGIGAAPGREWDDNPDHLCEAVSRYKVGHGMDERSTLAPLNNRSQYNFVKGLIERARQSGATVRELGQKLDPDNWDNGYFVLPVVVKDLAPTAELVLTELFGRS